MRNDVRVLSHGQFAALFAVVRRENLKIADPLEPCLEHVEVVVVVFDVEHSASIPLYGSSGYVVTRSPRRRAPAMQVAR
jgi:hypothetical protein